MTASRAWMVGAVLVVVLGVSGATGVAIAADEPVAPTLKAQVLRHYRVLVLRDGVMLTPRRGPSRSIELSGGSIAVNGIPMSGRELRDALGGDADLVLQLSYTSPAALRDAFGAAADGGVAPAPKEGAPAPPSPETSETPTAPSQAAPDVTTPEPPAPPEPPSPPRRKHGAKVNVGGSLTVDEDETVTDAVVAVGGNIDVFGRVEDDVVCVGGRVKLGPKAVVMGSVTAVGGRIEQEPGAEVHGDVNEVRLGFGPMQFGSPHFFGGFGHDMFSGWFPLFGTLLRIAVVMLLALVIVFAAHRPVERIARRAGDEPWLSGLVGLIAQVLFVPLTVVTVVVLAISIIGIPLLVLVPFALLALLVGVLLGFVGVARRVGEWAAGTRGPAVETAVGVVLIAAGTLVARLLWLLPGPIGAIAAVVWLVGLFLEYAAWTVGLGAMLLTRFGTRGPLTPEPVMASYPSAPPPIPPVERPESSGSPGEL
jgi:hypothetical protein